MTTRQPLLYLTESDVQQTLTVGEAVDLAEKGIRADAAGQVAGDKFYTAIGDRGFIKPFTGYIAGEDYFFVKNFTFFPDNPGKYGLPTTASQVLLYDAQTGLPVCLMEANWVTGLKTGASTAVTASLLARPESTTAAIFGAGLQGRMHTRALAHRFHLERVWLFDLYPEVAEAAAAELQQEIGLPVQAAALGNREQAVREADIVVTVTTGDQELVAYEWIKPGAFVAKLGSYTEVDLAVVTRADKVVVDNWHYVSPRIPELKTLLREGRFGRDHVHAEWPDIVAGRVSGRESESEIIVFIALGIWGEYAAILPAVYRRAREMGLGREIS